MHGHINVKISQGIPVGLTDRQLWRN